MVIFLATLYSEVSVLTFLYRHTVDVVWVAFELASAEKKNASEIIWKEMGICHFSDNNNL